MDQGENQDDSPRKRFIPKERKKTEVVDEYPDIELFLDKNQEEGEN